MNNQDNFSIKIKKHLFSRSVYDENKAHIHSEDLSCGLYCATKLKNYPKNLYLCVLLDRKLRFNSDSIINTDLSITLEKLCSTVRFLAEEVESKHVILAVTPKDSDDFEYNSAKAVVIGDTLKGYGIELYGYYLTDEFDFENITPDNAGEDM